MGAQGSTAAPMRTQTQEAPSMLLRVIFSVMACSPSLDLPLARLARRHAGIDRRDAAGGLRQFSERAEPIKNNPVDDLNTSLLRRAPECRRLAAHRVCI